MDPNKEVAKRWLGAIATGDADTLRELMTEDATWVLTGSVLAGTRDVDGLVELATGLSAAMEGEFVFDFLNFTAEEDRVAVEFTGKCTLMSGDAYDNRYHLLFFMRDGLIREVHEYLDTALVDEVVVPLLGAQPA